MFTTVHTFKKITNKENIYKNELEKYKKQISDD